MKFFLGSLLLILVPAGLLAQEALPEDVKKILTDAITLANSGKHEEAEKLLAEAVMKGAQYPETWVMRGRYWGMRKQADKAVADYDRAILLAPNEADLFEERGSEQFKRGMIKESIADFDRHVKLVPQADKQHWKRGISYYYAGRFADGKKQFEMYQEFDDSDVENAVWRFLCMAKSDGVEAARKGLLKIGDDRRVPMRQVYDMFAGQVTPEEVLKVAQMGDEKAQHRQLFYAHQYLALYYEALGEQERSLKHMLEAVERPIGHYMWDVAKVHVMLRKAPTKN